MIALVLSWSAVVAGLISAALWYRAATVVIKKGDPRAANDIFIGGDAVKTTARIQSEYNQYAAFVTAISVALQALAQVASH